MKLSRSVRFAIVAAVLSASAGTAAGVAVASTNDPIVYTCSAAQNGQPPTCQHDQEWAVYDTYGNPIASVGESGGMGVYGDKFEIYAPGKSLIGYPQTVIAAETPQAYYQRFGQSANCTAPEVWISNTGIYHCISGTWTLAIRL